MSSGQAARSAERALRDSNQEEVDRRAVIQGWRQIVVGLDEGLIELVATAAEQRAGHRPGHRLVRRGTGGEPRRAAGTGHRGRCRVRPPLNTGLLHPGF